MALEVLLYNLLVLGSSLRCMLHRHKSSIQNTNHSINSVGGQFLGNITDESLHGALLSLHQCIDERCAAVAVIGDENRQSEITADFLKFRYVNKRN